MLNNIKSQMMNFGLKFLSVDDKIVRMLLETASSNINEIVILPAVKTVMKKLVKKLHNKISHGIIYNGIRVSIILSHIGCPNIAMIMESLKRCKTKVVLRVDLCGGIQGNEEEITVGDVLVPKLAYCDDGTSPQYIRSNASLQSLLKSINNPLKMIQNLDTSNQIVYYSKPDETLKEILIKTGRNINPMIKEVDFWTTDALFCENSEFIRSLQSIDVQGIDMESSVLFLLGTLFNIKTASILAVTDLPGHPKYDLLSSNELHPNMEKGIDDAIKIVIESLPKIKSLFA
jgi:purine-nucleoside phosphorylase